MNIATLKALREDYRTAKTNFSTQYSVLSKYYYQIKKNESAYLNPTTQGEFLNDGSITENEGMKAAQRMVSAILGAVWKNDAKTFKLVPTKSTPITQDVKRYFMRINQALTAAMEHTKANFLSSFGASLLDDVIYGTAGIMVHAGDYSVPLRYQNKSPMSFYVGFNKHGEVDTVIIDFWYTAKELVDRFGEELVGGEISSAAKRNDQTTRFTMSQLIQPRMRKKAKLGVLAMPFSSYIFLPDQSKLLMESGFESLPLRVLFYRRLEQESYGRSPGMDALPTVIQSNIAAEILAVGAEITAQPVMGMFDDGTFGGKTVNLSAGAVNVFNVAANAYPSEKPLFPVYTVGDLSVMFEWWKILRERIYEFFLLDKLYDANQNPVQRTLGEAMMQNNIRSDALSAIFVQVMHFINGLIDRSVDIMYSMGLMGVVDPMDIMDSKVVALMSQGHMPFKIPTDVLNLMVAGRDWYDIEHISPAARVMRTDELQAVMTFLQTVGQAAQIDPEFLDPIDTDGTVEKLKDLLSTDMIMIRTADQIAARREQRRQTQEMMMQAEMQAQQAKANQSNGQAMAAKAGAMRTMMNPTGGGGQ